MARVLQVHRHKRNLQIFMVIITYYTGQLSDPLLFGRVSSIHSFLEPE